MLYVLIVHHVLGRRRKLLVPLDDFVHRVQKVLLRYRLLAGSDREHSRLRAHRSQLRSRGVGAQPRHQLVPDVSVHVHGLGVDAEDVRPPFQVRKAELNLERVLFLNK